MKKTLLVTLEHPPQIGGIATYCHDLAMGLDHEKIVVLAPSGDDRYASDKEKKEWDAKQPYKIIRRRLLSAKFIWPRWLRLCRELLRVCREEGIELVFVQHVLPVGYAAVFLHRFKRVPFLLFSHGTDLVAGTATPWKKKMVHLVSMHAAQIVFNSQSLMARYLKIFPEFEKKSSVVYPSPDPMFSEPPSDEVRQKLRSKYGLEGKRSMLTVSRIDEGKGFPHLIKYMPKILEKFPHLVWLIIGVGPKQQEMVRLIQKHNLQNIVRFVGEIPHEELRSYYYLTDAFVLLTHPDQGREEGLGLVFLEASAAGLPIVAGKSGGVEEGIIHNETGLVVDAYNEGECIAAIVRILEDREFALSLGQKARERIQKEFVWTEQVKKLDIWLEGYEHHKRNAIVIPDRDRGSSVNR